MKRPLPVETIVALALTAVLSAGVFFSGCDGQNSSAEGSYPDSESTTTFSRNNHLETIRHDGHLFVVYRVDASPDRPGGPLHHPSCDHEDCKQGD